MGESFDKIVLPPLDAADRLAQHHSGWPASDLETVLLQADDATLIARALRTLPDCFSSTLALRDLEGLSFPGLADVMGITIGTVMSRLSRARQTRCDALDSQPKPSCIPARMHLEDRRWTRH